MIPAKLYKADGSVQEVTPENGKEFTLEELQGFVGGYIQVLNPPSSQGVLFIINEEGKLLDLPVNRAATEAWGPVALPGDYIVGDVLVCLKVHLESGDDE